MLNQSLFFPNPPLGQQARWHDSHSWLVSTLPSALKPWLLDEGSLTQRLLNATDGDFSVNKLYQGWGRADLSEARCLGIAPRSAVIVREVELVCNGKPWVYARSIIPQQTLTGRLRSLKNLDNRPLGALLFKDPSMRRTQFDIGVIPTSQLHHLSHPEPEAALWGRRSLFFIDNKPILVSEIFLSALEA